MPQFYSGQQDYITKLNAPFSVNALTAVSSVGASSRALDLSLGNIFTVSISAAGIANLTLTITNAPVSLPVEITLYVTTTTANAHTIVWPTTTNWTSAPGSLSSIRTYVYKLITDGTASTWYGTAIRV